MPSRSQTARLARTALMLIAAAIGIATTASPAVAVTPNASLMLIGGGKAETGVLKNGTYTRKHRFALSGVTAAAADRSSLALYTKGTGRLRTGTFQGGTWTPVETISVRSGFTHAVGSCDSLLLYNTVSGRAMSGTLIGGRFRNRTSFFLPAGLTSLGSSCDTTWFSGPNLLAAPPRGMVGTLTGGDWVKTGDVYGTDNRIGMDGTSYIQWRGTFAAWGSAIGGVIDEVEVVNNFDPWDIVTGSANTFIYHQNNGFTCTQQVVGMVQGTPTCGSDIVTTGWSIIVGGR